MSYRVTFVLGAFRGETDRRESEEAMYILLQALVLRDLAYLRRHGAPALYRAGVRYEREPLGREDWQDIPITLRRRHGDCEDLACWRVAELRLRGIAAKPYVTWRPLRAPDGGTLTLYHIRVQWPDGRIECPSRVLGMEKIPEGRAAWVSQFSS